mgnify:CR=1 FL=1
MSRHIFWTTLLMVSFGVSSNISKCSQQSWNHNYCTRYCLPFLSLNSTSSSSTTSTTSKIKGRDKLGSPILSKFVKTLKPQRKRLWKKIIKGCNLHPSKAKKAFISCAFIKNRTIDDLHSDYYYLIFA